MSEIRFDFNNLFDANVGEHGVTAADIGELSAGAQAAHQHLKELFSNRTNRVSLGLEWAVLPEQNRAVLEKIQSLAKEICARFDNVLFLGIGGSYLGLKAAQDALALAYYNEFKLLRKGRPKIYFEGNNLDPDTLQPLLKNLNPKKTFVIVISKSGETTETKAAFMVVERWLEKGAGKNYGRQVLVITDPGSGALRKRADAEQKKDKFSFRSLPLLKGVGGRYSEFNMGLLHLALIGVRLEDVLQGARDMRKRCSEPDVMKNPAYLYAVAHTVLYKKKGKSIAVFMPFCEGLKSTADWYVQLLAESLGKKHSRKIESGPHGQERWLNGSVINVGRTPVPCRGTSDLHSVQQNNIEGENNKVTTFIRVEKFRSDISLGGKGDILSGRKYSQLLSLAQEATVWALAQEKRPSCTIIMPEVSAYHWGALLFFFQLATAFEAEFLNVNAFDQPGVEGYKNYMYYKLGRPGLPEDAVNRIKSSGLVKKQEYLL